MGRSGTGASDIALKCVGVFLLFALCGAGSALAAFNDSSAEHFSLLFPLPFALLFSVLFLRRTQEGHRFIFVVPLMMSTWYLSWFSAAITFGLYPVGGFIGGAALVLCTSICSPELASAKYLAAGALAGLFSSLSFLPYFDQYEMIFAQGYGSRPVLAFAFWEAMVGTYLYAVCMRISVRERVESQDEGESGIFRVTPR
jgi:hypothetical protein